MNGAEVLFIADAKTGVRFLHLCTLVNVIRSLPNSNANVKRIFSAFPDILRKKETNSAENVDALVTARTKLDTRKTLPQHMYIDDDFLLKMNAENVHKLMAKRANCACRFYIHLYCASIYPI